MREVFSRGVGFGGGGKNIRVMFCDHDGVFALGRIVFGVEEGPVVAGFFDPACAIGNEWFDGDDLVFDKGAFVSFVVVAWDELGRFVK